MSFLFGKKNKQQANALPAATREITSSHGPGQATPPVAPNVAPNGAPVREVEKIRAGPQMQTPTPERSVNNSLSSLQNQPTGNAPEPKALRDRADPNSQVYIACELSMHRSHYASTYTNCTAEF
jgi:hypothetical protein